MHEVLIVLEGLVDTQDELRKDQQSIDCPKNRLVESVFRVQTDYSDCPSVAGGC